MKILKIIIGTFLLIGSVNASINGLQNESGAGLAGYLIGTGIFGFLGALLIINAFKTK